MLIPLWVKAAAFAVIVAAAFAAGYVTATHSALRIAAGATQVAQKAQEKHDVQMHGDAVKLDHVIVLNDANFDKKTRVIVKRIHDLEPNPQNACDVPVDVLKQLNDAGHYPQ